MMPLFRVLIASFATLLVSGCAIKYEPVRLDSPPPLEEFTKIRCPSRLEISESCSVLVQADQWESPTGITIESGETYCIQVPLNQVWFDLDRRNTPPYGERGSWWMRLSNQRHDAGFFSLMVDTKSDINGELLNAQAVEKNAAYQSKDFGKLVFYPNDAIGSESDPASFYKNNAGQIWLTVQRCGNSCLCPTASERQLESTL